MTHLITTSKMLMKPKTPTKRTIISRILVNLPDSFGITSSIFLSVLFISSNFSAVSFTLYHQLTEFMLFTKSFIC